MAYNTLLHQDITFAGGGYAYAIINEGETEVYFRIIGARSEGINCDVGGNLNVADAEALIALLRAATDQVKANIAAGAVDPTGDTAPAPAPEPQPEPQHADIDEAF